MKQTIAIVAFFAMLTALFPLQAFADTEVNYSHLLSDTELEDLVTMNFTELEAFLTRGSLATYETDDINDKEKSAAEIIWDVSQEFGISPQFILVMLQREQSLVEDDSPSQDQLDWAMGYAVCDDCSKNDPLIQKYKGFGNQVYYAMKRIRESYLDDLESRGYTISGYGPGIAKEVDGQTIIPANYATSILYTYTPHLHGNENFYYIWQDWFTHTYPNGTLLQDLETGGIWYLQHGQRRAITSASAYYSRFPNQPVISTTATMLEKYPEGPTISFSNYSLLRSPRGTVYLIVDDSKRGIVSMEAFRAIGFNTDEIIDVSFEDLEAYDEGEPLTTESVYPAGTLLQNNATGGVYYVKDNLKHPLMSREILDVRFANQPILAKSPEELDAFETAVPVTFPDGTLVIADGSPDVFVISEGERRLIPDETTFLGYGWSWTDLVFTTERTVLLHPLGQEIDQIDEETGTIEQASF